MPEAKSTTRFFVSGNNVFSRRSGVERCFCVAEGDAFDGEGEAMARQIAEALSDAIEHPWVDDGPTVAEARGESILVRINGKLEHAEFSHSNLPPGWYWGVDGIPAPKLAFPPTGWRRMPKAREVSATPPCAPGVFPTLEADGSVRFFFGDSAATVRRVLEAALAYSLDVTEEPPSEGEIHEALAALDEIAHFLTPSPKR